MKLLVSAALAVASFTALAPAPAHAAPPCATFCVSGAPISCGTTCELPGGGTIKCRNYGPAVNICRGHLAPEAAPAELSLTLHTPSLTELASAIFSTAYASVSSASAGLVS